MTEYDGIIVGAGHNGLTLAGYLSKAGFSILVLEDRINVGGGCSTADPAKPGYYLNLHANFHQYALDSPVISDLELQRYGVEFIFPENPVGHAFSDGKALVANVDLQKTVKSIERFSKKDAGTFRDLHETFGTRLSDVMLYNIYSPPPLRLPPHLSERIKGKDRDIMTRFSKMTALDAINETFEDEHVRSTLLFNMTAAGFNIFSPGTGSIVMGMINRFLRKGICVGGSYRLAYGLAAYTWAHGGTILVQSRVEKVMVRDGRCIGVRTIDGREFMARKFVVSAVDAVQTLGMVGEENFEPAAAEKIKNWKWGAPLIVNYLGLNEPPKFLAARDDPQMDTSLSYIIGYESTSDIVRHMHEIERGELSGLPGGNGATNTLFDKVEAPPGKHVTFWWPYVPAHPNEGGWDQVKERYHELCLEVMRKYIRNLDDGNVIFKYASSPLEMAERNMCMVDGDWREGDLIDSQMGVNRPYSEYSRYRGPLEGLYLCGSQVHPGPNITFGSGYNAAGVICDDFGVQRWWKEIGT